MRMRVYNVGFDLGARDCRRCPWIRFVGTEMVCFLDEQPVLPGDARWCAAYEDRGARGQAEEA